MAGPKAPDYPLEDFLKLDTPEQHRALFEETRMRVVALLLERAATVSELAKTLGRPKGTVGHHVSVLEGAGLIRVVRTKKVRAIEAKYYGRTARTYLLNLEADTELAPDTFLTIAAGEYAQAALPGAEPPALMSTLRYARIPEERAEEWTRRLIELAVEFTAQERGGNTTFGLLLALYPTERPRLPKEG